MVEDVLRNPVVEHTLAIDYLMFLLVERGRVVLEELNQGAGLGSLIQNLCFAFIDSPTAIHGLVPRFEEIHSFARGGSSLLKAPCAATRAVRSPRVGEG